MSLAAAELVCGELAVGAATVRLTATATPCKRVWIGAPTANHAGGANTGNILVGDATTQVRTIQNTDYAGIYVHVSDASKIYCKGFNAGDVVEYMIEN